MEWIVRQIIRGEVMVALKCYLAGISDASCSFFGTEQA